MNEKEIGNWGKWGPDDQVGTANYITPPIVVDAARLVRKGKVYSLACPLSPGMPPHPGRNDLVHLSATYTGKHPKPWSTSEDVILVNSHGTTHIDALGHFCYDGKMYNGYDASAIDSTGTRRNGIENLKGLVTRGVLLDIAAYKKVLHLDAGYEITPEDVQRCAKSQGTEVRQGDAVLLRTGWMKLFPKEYERFYDGEPGINLAAAEWFKHTQISCLGADNYAVESVRPGEGTVPPVHIEMLRNQGCYLMEMLTLDEPAADKAYEFLFVAAPLRLKRGLGSPINPLAVT